MSESENVLTPAQVGAEFIRAKQRPNAEQASRYGDRVFRDMHGFYGSLWLSKFSTGLPVSHNSRGEPVGDKGVDDARRLWGFALTRYTGEVIVSAMGRCLKVHPEFPPSLPQFVALCEACKPAVVYRPAGNALPMSQELRSQYARRARETLARHEAKRRKLASGEPSIPAGVVGLGALQLLVAGAVGAAGGDEVACLRRFDATRGAA